MVMVFVAVFLVVGFVGCASERTVEKVEITRQPDKVVYEEGETFDPEGMTVQVTFSDGSSEEVTDYTIDKTGLLTPEDTEIRVRYGGRGAILPITVTYLGNNEKYSVANTPALENSPLYGNTYLFLGSSVTAGSEAEYESMADFIAKKYSCSSIKLAVPGTSLANVGSNSYVARLDDYIASEDMVQSLDAFICQLSTNDMYYGVSLEDITADDVRDAASFDTTNTFGAIEYIIARVYEVWGCSVVFYTNPDMGNDVYATMVEGLYILQEKWGITIIDLYNNEEINSISDEERSLYMVDDIHPTRAGYRELWLPEFEECLIAIEENVA